MSSFWWLRGASTMASMIVAVTTGSLYLELVSAILFGEGGTGRGGREGGSHPVPSQNGWLNFW